MRLSRVTRSSSAGIGVRGGDVLFERADQEHRQFDREGLTGRQITFRAQVGYLAHACITT
jgi:hypothetical protein